MTRLFVSGAAVGALLLSAASLSSLAAFADPATGASSSPNAATPPANASAAPKADDRDSGADWKARMRADHEAFFAARLAALHAGLQLKPEQDGLWMPVETAIRDLAHARGHHHGQTDASDADHDGRGSASNDDLRMQSARLIRVGNAMKALADAADPLVASMTPEQKDRLPKLLDGLRPKHVLMRAFGLDGNREAMDEGHEGHHHWRHEADRDDDGRGSDDRRGGREHGFDRHDHGGWMEGDRDDRDGGSEWHHHRHHHHDDENNDDEPMHS
jgi:hypothetical protein